MLILLILLLLLIGGGGGYYGHSRWGYGGGAGVGLGTILRHRARMLHARHVPLRRAAGAERGLACHSEFIFSAS